MSPIEKLTGAKKSFELNDNHAFGCPAHVLSVDLQDQKSIPRRVERIRVGVHLGRSKQHASNVALILNLKTGHVSPQYHVVFDDNFETVQSLRDGIEPTRCKWLVEHKRAHHKDDDGNIIDGTKA